jgi:hypothetical protein
MWFMWIEQVEAVLRAPVLSHFSESVAGAQTLRAFGNATTSRWTDSAFSKFDASAKAFLAQKVRNL